MTAVQIVELGIQVRCLGVLNTCTSLFFRAFFYFFSRFRGEAGEREKVRKIKLRTDYLYSVYFFSFFLKRTNGSFLS